MKTWEIFIIKLIGIAAVGWLMGFYKSPLTFYLGMIFCISIYFWPEKNKNMTTQKFPIQPVEDKLIVKKETVTVGERKFEVRDEDLKKTPVACQVMACGPGTETRSMPVKDGDRVLISRMAGFEVEHEGENYLLITLNDIIGVLEPVKDVQVVER